MSAHDDYLARQAIRSISDRTRLTSCAAAERPDLWALPSVLGPTISNTRALLVVDPNAFPSRPEEYRLLIVADDLELEDVSKYMAAAQEILDREVEQGHPSGVLWRYLPDDRRIVVFSRR
ncbi:hypothetical protein [Nocardioides sp. L-11A]|uniref:hypothetical protein n=1 Tax=Nocardioides sp. L-11A TaxID=3043848 RepID=UPI00249B1CD9|nr:hypothetical protein QJ852_06445 [Nocardioides sp. L-11A]